MQKTQDKTGEMNRLFDTTGYSHTILQDPGTAHLVVHHNKVLGAHLVPGLHVTTGELEDGIKVDLQLDEGVIIESPVHVCFGMLPEKGIQRVTMSADIGKNSSINIFAHCTFPNAIDVQHIMEGKIRVGEDARFTYFERHVHSDEGGVKVFPKAQVELEKGAHFRTVFELLEGRVGHIEIDYTTLCKEQSVMEMTAKINGRGDDRIIIRETGYLTGEGSRGVLTSRVAARDNARAEVYNEITASAPDARGHVDCKEIIQGNGSAQAVPIVKVLHPKAHVTHEAAIGSVDSKELDTLMSRGLSEDDAVDLIIAGLLS